MVWLFLLRFQFGSYGSVILSRPNLDIIKRRRNTNIIHLREADARGSNNFFSPIFHFCLKQWKIYLSLLEEDNLWKPIMMLEDYTAKSMLSESSTSTVWLAKHKLTGEEAVMKCFDLSKLNRNLRTCLNNELEFLSSVDNPNIIRLLHVFQVRIWVFQYVNLFSSIFQNFVCLYFSGWGISRYGYGILWWRNFIIVYSTSW